MNLEPITRESKKAKVRKDIINAAFSLFEEQGYSQTTVDMIAAASGVSTRTFFRYFPTKDLVAFPYHSEYVSLFKRQLKKKSKSLSPMETVRRGLRTMANHYQKRRQDHLIYQRVISSSPDTLARSIQFDADWENAIADVWKVGGDLSENQVHQANMIAGLIMGVVKVVMEKWYASDCRENLVKLGEAAMDLVECGIAAKCSFTNEKMTKSALKGEQS